MILVTGGAGYVGSHALRALQSAGRPFVVLDNLSSGNHWALPEGCVFYEGDIRDQKLVRDIVSKHNVESLLHFAAHIAIEESVKNPLKFYDNNFLGTRLLAEAVFNEGVKKFIFSSTCAVYGKPERVPVDEHCQIQPINPYGRSKAMSEWVLADLASIYGAKGLFLRYFNVAGAQPNGGIGEATPESTHLIKLCAEVACGKRPYLNVFGSDYSTPDGTCLRDYIHVDDLAEAHLLALSKLDQIESVEAVNLGYGKPYSVMEVIQAMKKVTGIDFELRFEARRPGDAESIYCDPRKAISLFDFKPRFANIELICESAYQWERTLNTDND